MDNFKLLYNESDKRLQAIDPLVRSKVLIAVEKDVHEIQKNSPELTEAQTISRWLEGSSLNQKLLSYLKDYGVHQMPQPEKSILKTLILAFAVIVVSFFIFIAVIFSMMSPVLEFNEKGIALFGGRFQISDGVKMDIKTSQRSFSINNNSAQEQGRIDLSDQKAILVSITQGHVIFNNAPSDELIWECVKPAQEIYKGQVLSLELGEDNQCHIHLPQDKNYKFNVQQGLVTIHDPKYNLDLFVEQGQVQLKPDELLTYKFNLNVQNGVAEVFESQEKDFNYSIDIKVNDGMISHSY